MYAHGDNIFAIVCWQFLNGWLGIAGLRCYERRTLSEFKSVPGGLLESATLLRRKLIGRGFVTDSLASGNSD
jgi:hypothetical protein